jgi:HD-like signal output (HDOD) protein
LTAETLKRSNSASFRGAERTTDVFEAMSRLGFYELYGIINASISSRTPSPGMQGTADLEAL